MTLLRMTLSGSILIVIACVFRLLLQNRVHRSVFPALWTLISLRMLIPFFLPVNITVSESSRITHLAEHTNSIQVAADRVPSSAKAAFMSLSSILLIIWLSGVGICLLVFVWIHLRSVLRYRFSLPIPDGKINHPEKLRIRMLDGLDSPLTYGILRPTILLPAGYDWNNQKALSHILTHEKMHIRYRDLPRKALLIFVTALHWFNPLAWLMLRLAALDMEIRCDAAAVSFLGMDNRKAYAKTLVSMEQRRFNLLQTGFSFNHTLTRLKALSKAKISGAISTSISVLVSAFVVISCLAPSFSSNSPLTQMIPTTFVSELNLPLEPEAYTEPEIYTEPETEALADAIEETLPKTKESTAETGSSAQVTEEYSAQNNYQDYGQEETILLPDSFSIEEKPENQTNTENSSSYNMADTSYLNFGADSIYDFNSSYFSDPNYVYVIPIDGTDAPHYAPRDSVGPQPCIPGASVWYP